MNRLILLGNGFDLAHGMKTKYFDFVFFYMKECFLNASSKGVYTDGLINIDKILDYETHPIEEITHIDDFLYFAKPVSSVSYDTIAFGNSSGRSRIKQLNKTYRLQIISSFFNHLLNHCCDYNWVDIENEYYRELKDLLQSRDDVKNRLTELNDSMGWIKQKLEEYLSTQFPNKLNNIYGKIFTETIKKDEVVTMKLIGDLEPEAILILNFNYTDTARNYILRDSQIKINYIHGKLNEKDNPLIFGFGDELDESYSKIEGDKRKGVLKYIKSFWYFKTTNYHNLIRFIESTDFQVYILGHSCGLSDRTMLNMIFEHTNCKSIKIFYHQQTENNYTDLTEEISRHFKNKTEMRKKIVPEEESKEMPQIV